MPEEDLKIKFNELQRTLNDLEEITLPDEARSVLDDVLRSVEEFSSALEDTRYQARLAALYNISHTVGASLNLDEVLAQVMDAVIHLTGAERGFLVLLDTDVEKWRLRAARNYNQENLEPKDMEISRTVIEATLKNRHGVVTTDAQVDPRFATQRSVVFYALHSILCAPLFAHGQVIGAIYVDNRTQTGLFNTEDLRLLEAFAAQAAIAIENARLYTRTDRALALRVAELEILRQVDRDLNASLDLQHVLELTRQWILRGVPAAQAGIFLTLPQERYAQEPKFLLPEGVQAGLPDEPLVRLAAETLETQKIPASGSEMAHLAVPLLHGGKLLGVLTVDGVETFDPEAAQFLEHLAARAAPALENARLYEAVQSANQAKSKFVSVVTHELRIPMTSIKGYTDLIRQGAVGPVNEMQLNFLNVVRNNVDRMSALVSDLADISRIETGRLKLERRAVEVRPMIDDAVSSLQLRIEEKSHALEISVPAGLPGVDADPTRVVQILTNLLSNAIRYTPNQGQVRIEAAAQGSFVLFQVVDNGIGISETDQAMLFTQFFRSEDPRVREQPGWGLGLSVSQRLVELMGGKIEVESVPNRGTTVRFTLPAYETLSGQ